MKQAIIVFGLVLTLTTACNQGKEKETSDGVKDTTVTTTTKNDHDEAAISGDELSKLKPLREEELKAMLPTSLAGYKQTSVYINSDVGALTAVADYQSSDTTQFELIVIDCAGPGGAGIYNLQYIGMLGMSEEDEEEYMHTVDFKGGKAFENCSKINVHCSLTWFSKRFMITVDGALPREEVHRIASDVRF